MLQQVGKVGSGVRVVLGFIHAVYIDAIGRLPREFGVLETGSAHGMGDAQHLLGFLRAGALPAPHFGLGVALLHHQQLVHGFPSDGTWLFEDEQQGFGLAQAGEVVEVGVLVVLVVHVVAAIAHRRSEEEGHTTFGEFGT